MTLAAETAVDVARPASFGAVQILPNQEGMGGHGEHRRFPRQ